MLQNERYPEIDAKTGDPPSVGIVLNQTQECLIELSNRVEDLTDRLSPVLKADDRPGIEEKNEAQKMPNVSSLYMDLVEKRVILIGITNKLESLFYRINL